MVDNYTKDVLKVCVAQICQMIGWTAIQSTPLELITDILHHYMKSLATRTHNYAMLFNQTEPNLDHVGLAFNDMGISVTELEEYVKYVDSPGPALEVPKYPIPCQSHLNHLKPGSREVLTRPVHIHEHLPPMHPHLEDMDYSKSPVSVDIGVASESTSPLASPKSNNVFKRPGDPISDVNLTKRLRPILEEESRPLREISSVMMTTSGFLSPAREGKLPEARTPIVDTGPSSPEPMGVYPSPPDRPEKKKKIKLSSDTAPLKHQNKENKKEDGEFEVVKEDEVKVKKLASMKETSKLKAFKHGAHKIASGTSLPKLPKINKLKPSSTQSSPSGTPKSCKSSQSKSQKGDKFSNAISAKEPSSAIVSQNYDGKLTSEPDKQKLNIFRKISKVKEDHVEVSDNTKAEPETHEMNWSQIDETIEAVIQKGRTEVKEEIEIKEEHVDIEATLSPPHYDQLLFDDHSIPGTPTTPRTPELPRTEHKKKRKDKHKDKREAKEKYNLNQSPKSKYTPEIEYMAKPKTPEVDLTPEDNPPAPVFPFFSHFPSGPGLIPAPLPMLFPHLPMAKHPVMPNLPIPPPLLSSLSHDHSFDKSSELSPLSSAPSAQTSTPLTSASNSLIQMPFGEKTSEQPSSLKRKEKKEKKAKDKLKKKKEKKEKTKDKEKSKEKKKIKLDKREKDKDKVKLKKDKKEKKKEKETTEDRPEPAANPLPKITLKLGPASPQDTQETIHRKIVIKPLVKKEDEASKPERAPSPELARIAPLIPRLNKHKIPRNLPTGSEEPLRTHPPSINQIIPIIPEKPEPPVAVRLDNDGNEVWICPECGRQDDGSPMIGCDGCDAWYHWVCVGIQVPPLSSDWFCRLCIHRKANEVNDRKKKYKKKKFQH